MDSAPRTSPDAARVGRRGRRAPAVRRRVGGPGPAAPAAGPSRDRARRGDVVRRSVEFATGLGLSTVNRWSLSRPGGSGADGQPVRPPIDYWPWAPDEADAADGGPAGDATGSSPRATRRRTASPAAAPPPVRCDGTRCGGTRRRDDDVAARRPHRRARRRRRRPAEAGASGTADRVVGHRQARRPGPHARRRRPDRAAGRDLSRHLGGVRRDATGQQSREASGAHGASGAWRRAPARPAHRRGAPGRDGRRTGDEPGRDRERPAGPSRRHSPGARGERAPHDRVRRDVTSDVGTAGDRHTVARRVRAPRCRRDPSGAVRLVRRARRVRQPGVAAGPHRRRGRSRCRRRPAERSPSGTDAASRRTGRAATARAVATRHPGAARPTVGIRHGGAGAPPVHRPTRRSATPRYRRPAYVPPHRAACSGPSPCRAPLPRRVRSPTARRDRARGASTARSGVGGWRRRSPSGSRRRPAHRRAIEPARPLARLTSARRPTSVTRRATDRRRSAGSADHVTGRPASPGGLPRAVAVPPHRPPRRRSTSGRSGLRHPVRSTLASAAPPSGGRRRRSSGLRPAPPSRRPLPPPRPPGTSWCPHDGAAPRRPIPIVADDPTGRRHRPRPPPATDRRGATDGTRRAARRPRCGAAARDRTRRP